jgi:hypothetical protein
MVTLPQPPAVDAAATAAQLMSLITMDASILFVVLGQSPEATTLLALASQQTNTGSTTFVRKVVLLTSFLEAVQHPSLSPFLSNGNLVVNANCLGFTIGFGDKVAKIFNPGDTLTAFEVFLAFAAAEAQP